MSDLISRQAAIDAMTCVSDSICQQQAIDELCKLPSAQPERLTDDDFETIRIHLNAFKENLCNQQRWKEAEEYERIIDRFMGFASAQPERKTGKWIYHPEIGWGETWLCDQCGEKTTSTVMGKPRANFCPNCGADMRGEQDE